RDQREPGTAAIQHGAELLAIRGQQRVTPVSSTVDHCSSLEPPRVRGQCAANCKIKVSNRPKWPVLTALKGCISACLDMYRVTDRRHRLGKHPVDMRRSATWRGRAARPFARRPAAAKIGDRHVRKGSWPREDKWIWRHSAKRRSRRRAVRCTKSMGT